MPLAVDARPTSTTPPLAHQLRVYRARPSTPGAARSASAASTPTTASAGTSAGATSRTTAATPVVVDWRAGRGHALLPGDASPTRSGSPAAAASCSTAASSSSLFDEDFDDPDSAHRGHGRARPAARRARPRPHRRDPRHRRHDPGRAGRGHPRPARAAASSCRAVRAPARRRSACTAPRSCSTSTASCSSATACSSSGPNRAVPALHRAGAAVARRDVGHADDGRRASAARRGAAGDDADVSPRLKGDRAHGRRSSQRAAWERTSAARRRRCGAHRLRRASGCPPTRSTRSLDGCLAERRATVSLDRVGASGSAWRWCERA